MTILLQCNIESIVSLDILLQVKTPKIMSYQKESALKVLDTIKKNMLQQLQQQCSHGKIFSNKLPYSDILESQIVMMEAKLGESIKNICDKVINNAESELVWSIIYTYIDIKYWYLSIIFIFTVKKRK